MIRFKFYYRNELKFDIFSLSNTHISSLDHMSQFGFSNSTKILPNTYNGTQIFKQSNIIKNYELNK